VLGNRASMFVYPNAHCLRRVVGSQFPRRPLSWRWQLIATGRNPPALHVASVAATLAVTVQ
ncbi:MAG: hypothetical protein ACKO0N_14630, partial [Planctomycetota bacterium]